MIPERHREIGERFLELLTQLDARIDAAGDGRVVDYAEVEEQLASGFGDLERAAHRACLAALDVDEPSVRIRGRMFKRVGRYPGTYRTLSGPVAVERSLYRQVGKRNARTVDAVSLRTGVVGDGWLPRAARAMAYLIAMSPSREAAATSSELMRLPYSRCSFERVAHRVGELYNARRDDIDRILTNRMDIPDEAASVSVSLDRVSVPMEEDVEDLVPENVVPVPKIHRPRYTPPDISPEVRRQLNEGRASAPKCRRSFRMAYCATVTLHDADGEALHTIRYGRMPHENSSMLVRRLGEDVDVLLRRAPRLRVVLLADGAPEIWNLFDGHLSDRRLRCVAMRLVDFWHVIERLAECATIWHRHGGPRDALQKWRHWLRYRDDGPERVLRQLLRTGCIRARVQAREPIREAIRYIRTRLDRMRYATARRNGLPIGSGAVEATCKSLVSCRMKRCGARWKREGGSNVIQLRALVLSDRWGDAVQEATKPKRIRVLAAA